MRRDVSSLRRFANRAGILTLIFAAGILVALSPQARAQIAPAFTAQPASLTVTQGNNASFTATATGSAPLAYQWFFQTTNRIANATNASLILTNVQGSNAGTYFIRVTNRTGSASSTNAILTVRLPPRIIEQPTNTAVFEGSPATMHVAAIGDPTLRFQWYYGFTNPISGATSSNYNIATVGFTNVGRYSVVITNLYGSITSTAALLSIPQPAFITQQPTNQTLAVGSTAVFFVGSFGTAPLTYQWFFNVIYDLPGETNQVLRLTNVQPSQSGTYQVEITNPADTVNSVEAVLRVLIPPAITQQPPPSLSTTQGQTTTFRAVTTGDNPAHQWFFNGTNRIFGATNTTLTLTNTQPSEDGTYTLRVTNEVGVIFSTPSALTVLRPPVITQHPANITATLGSPATFSVLAAGSDPLAYIWRRNGTNLVPVSTNLTLTLPAVQAADAGTYTVVVTNLAGSVTSSVATLNVITPPSITQQPTNTSVIQGGTASLLVLTSGSEPLAYRWFRNGTNAVANATNSTLNILNVQPAGAGTYSVIVTNLAGAATSGVATITVRTAPIITQQPVNRAVVPNGFVSFTVAATGEAPLAYQWFFNGNNPIPDATNTAFTIANVDASHVGSYSARITNVIGSVTSAGAILTIKPAPVITQQPASLIVTQGNSVSFTVAATSEGSIGYRWLFNDTNILNVPNSPTLFLSNIQTAQAGLYSVFVTNDAGGTLSAGATLAVRTPPVVVQHPATTSVTSGGTASFTAIVSGDQPLRYQWFFENTNALAGATNTTLIIAGAQLANDGRYSVRVTNDVGNTTSANASLRVRSLPTITQAPSSLTVTQGHNASFTVIAGGDGPFGYQWFFNGTNAIANARNSSFTLSNVPPAAAGNYSVQITNLVGTVTSPEAALTVRLTPTITQQPAGAIVPPGTNFSFTVAVTGEQPFTYQWRFNGLNNLVGATNTSLTLPNISLADAGSYSVVIQNPVGVTSSAVAVLTVKLPPTITQQPISLIATQYQSTTFNIIAGGDSPFAYQWFRDNTNAITAATNSSLMLANVQSNDAAEYSVLITNIVGSIRSAAASLTVRLLPQITQQPQSLTVTQGQAASFTVSSTSETPLTYQWRRSGTILPAANTAGLNLTNIQPAQAGGYDVIVANDHGSITSAVAVLTVFGIDFGDAPEPFYPTLAENDGARHIIVPGFHLGTGVDAEPNGQPTSGANGDDLNSSNDEQGVRFLTPLRLGQDSTIEVVASAPGFLNGWVDFDRASGWAQDGEQVITNLFLLAGTNTIILHTPLTALVGATFARFRFSTEQNLSFTGLAHDGEVEDYALSIQPVADLALVHAATASGVPAGGNATITLAVTNRGPSAASSVVLINQLSTRSTFISAVADSGSCAINAGLVTCNLGELPNGAITTVTLVARIGQGANIAASTVSAAEFDPNTTDNTTAPSVTGTAALPQYANSDAIIMPFPESGPANPYGAPIFVSGVTAAVHKITVTLRNVNHDFPDDIDILLVGPRGEKMMLMSDAGLDGVLVDTTITFDQDAATAIPDNQPITPGSYRPGNYALQADAFPAPAPPAPYTANLDIVRGTDPNGVWALYVVDDSPENNGSEVPGFIADGWTLNITTGDPISDLALTQNSTPAPATVGTPLVYTLHITNRGPASTAATLNDTLPSGVNFISATVPGGSCVHVSGLVTCELANLSAGSESIVTLTVLPAIGSTIANTATVTAVQLDIDPTNNTSTSITTVLPVADLELTLAAPVTRLHTQTVAYQITVTNRGPNTASAVQLTNILPAGMTFLSATASEGACTNIGGTVSCALGDLASGSRATVTITARAATLGANSNQAHVAAAELDPAPGNNDVAHLLNVDPATDLRLTSSASSTVPIGREYILTLVVTNRGPGTSDVTLFNPLPPGINFVSAVSARGACSNAAGTVQCQFISLAPGEAATATLSLQPTALGTLTNIGNVSGAIGELNPADNSVTNIVTVVPASDLAIIITDRPDPAWVGDTLVYTVAITNQGPNSATGVLVTNLLPPGVTFLSATPGQGSCARTGSEVTCDLGILSLNAGTLINISVRPTLPGLLTNSALVASQLFDANTLNNTAAQSTRVIAPAGTYFNNTPVSTPLLGLANPFPSTISVSGLTAAVFRVRVTLTNLNHTYPDDLDILLVAPDGRSTILMSDAGGDFALINTSLVFDDNAPASLPDFTAITGGLVRPTNYGAETDIFSAPAPLGPYGTNLAVFNGTDPNGTWSLFIMDDADKDSGILAGGWSLTLSTLEPLADLVLAGAVSANPVATGSNLVFSYTITNRGPAAAINTWLTNSLPTGFIVASYTNSQGACALTGETLVCALGNLPSGSTATIVVNGSSLVAGTSTNTAAVSSDGLDLRPTNNTVTATIVFDVPPLITVQPAGQTVAPGGLAQLNVAAIGAAPLNFQWQQDGIDLPGANGPTLVFNPVSNANAGIYRVRVSNQVGNILSDPAALLVTGPPFLSTISDLVIDEDISTGAIPFTVLDFDTPAISVNVTAESSNQTLVPASGIALVGSGSVRSIRITPATNQSGTATISLTALDTTGASTTNRFLLTVRPVVDTIQIVTQPRSSVAATGSVASLTVTANSTLPLTYQWQFNGIEISGATATTFTITGVQRTNAGNFRVIISNADTTVTSATATLQVFDQLEGPTIVSVTRTGLSATVIFTTLAGPGYRLEYKNTFSDPAWTLVNSTTGTGNNVSIVDPDASVPTRFYRVRIE